MLGMWVHYYLRTFVSWLLPGWFKPPMQKELRANVTDLFKDLPLAAVQQHYKDTSSPEIMACLNLTGDQNVGMIVRSSSLFGLTEVAIVGRRPYNRRSTVGMHNYIPTKYYPARRGHHSEEYDVPAILQLLTEFSETHTIVFVEQGGIPLNGAFDDFPDKPAFFVMGNEGEGIPDAILEFQPSVTVSIPQRGVGRSHNVANAAAMVLWEYYRNKF